MSFAVASKVFLAVSPTGCTICATADNGPVSFAAAWVVRLAMSSSVVTSNPEREPAVAPRASAIFSAFVRSSDDNAPVSPAVCPVH